MDDSVAARAVCGGQLYAGGGFTTAGDKLSSHIARANLGSRLFLSILQSGSDLVLFWPSAGSEDYLLEETTCLTNPASWTTNGAVFLNGATNKTATLPATGNQLFFRLHKP